MQALKYKAEVGAEGEITLPRLRLDQGTPVEVIVLVREPKPETDALLVASESSTAFWDNPIDEAVWNNA
jgi:hypothetical protein